MRFAVSAEKKLMNLLEPMNLLYRFGFICYASVDEPQGDDAWRTVRTSWNEHEVGHLVVRTHPECRYKQLTHPSLHIVLIGDAFSTDVEEVAEHASRIYLSEGRLWGLESLSGLSGRFAMVIVSKGFAAVLHDAFGARSIYYKGSGTFAFASHAQLLAHAFGVKRRGDIAALIRSDLYSKRIVKYLPGNATVFEDIHSVIPNTYLSSESRKLVRYWPIEPLRGTTKEAFLNEADNYFEHFLKFFTVTGRKPLFGITGGIDTRTIFSAFVRSGHSFRGVTWLGGYLREEEKETVQRIVQSLKIPHDYIQPNQFKSAEVGKVADRNVGGFRGPARLTEAMHALFGGEPDLTFVRGYGGEIIRGFYNRFGVAMRDFSAREMSRVYGTGSKPKELNKFAPSVVIRKCFDEFYESAGYEALESSSYDPNDIFYWEQRMGAWGTAMLNEMDPAVYSLVGLNSRKLFQTAFGVPSKDRLTKELLHAVVARQCPELADIAYG
jgi:hypothetical protein